MSIDFRGHFNWYLPFWYKFIFKFISFFVLNFQVSACAIFTCVRFLAIRLSAGQFEAPYRNPPWRCCTGQIVSACKHFHIYTTTLKNFLANSRLTAWDTYEAPCFLVLWILTSDCIDVNFSKDPRTVTL
jgi:hypothetical protein